MKVYTKFGERNLLFFSLQDKNKKIISVGFVVLPEVEINRF